VTGSRVDVDALGLNVVRRVRRLLAAGIVLLYAQSANGLSYREHEGISTLAFRSAVERLKASPAARMMSDADFEILHVLEVGDPARKIPSYGQLVGDIDYVLDEREYFRAAPGRCAGDWYELDLEWIATLGHRTADLLASSLRDEAHFQQETLRAAKHWQAQALDHARRHCSVVSALARSAISAHFLEDFLTPGHVFATKDGRPAADTVTVHNAFNTGVVVAVTDSGWLEGLVEQGLTGTTLRLLEEAGRTPAEFVNHLTVGGFRFVGDWRLTRGLESGGDACEQQILLVLLVGQATYEVLDAYYGGPVPASFGASSVFDALDWQPEARETSVGPLSFSRSRRPRLSYLALTLGTRSGVGSASASTGALVQLETDEFVFSWLFDRHRSPVKSLERRVAVLTGLAAGYDGRWWSIGPSERLVWAAIPRIDLHASGEIGFKIESMGGNKATTRGSYGGRLEMGTGLAFVGVGGTWERVSKGPNAGRAGFVITSTVTWYDVGFLFRPKR
jgi:hypothetical protein